MEITCSTLPEKEHQETDANNDETAIPLSQTNNTQNTPHSLPLRRSSQILRISMTQIINSSQQTQSPITLKKFPEEKHVINGKNSIVLKSGKESDLYVNNTKTLLRTSYLSKTHSIRENISPTPSSLERNFDSSLSFHVISESQNSSLKPHPSLYTRAAKLEELITDEGLNRLLKKNLWEIDVKRTLKTITRRLYRNSEIQFRIGGRVLFSASRIVNIKSNKVIEESHQTQEKLEEELRINEVEDENIFPEEEFGDDMGYSMEEDPIISQHTKSLQSILHKQERLENPFHTSSIINTEMFFREDRNGNRFLAPPIRRVYRRIDFQDLGEALVKPFSSSKRRRKKKRTPLISVNEILPSNIIKKAEEKRALVEEQIESLYQKILTLFQNMNHIQFPLDKLSSPEYQEKSYVPVPFRKILIGHDSDAIVRTLLYILHLINRNKIDVWQKIEEDHVIGTSQDVPPLEEDGINIYIAPRIEIKNDLHEKKKG